MKKPLIDKIYEHIKNSEIPISPIEIADHLKANRGTVRARLTELRRKGLINKPFHGVYSCDKIHGGRESPEVQSGGIRFQNLHVLSKKLVKRIFKRERLVKEWLGVGPNNTGYMKIVIELGKTYNRVNWRLSANEGVDLHGLRLARAYVESVLEARGFADFGWVVKSLEQLQDFMGVRIEGISSMTLDALDSTMEKYYQKSYGLRHEVRSNRSMKIDEFFALQQGGVPSYNIIQSVYSLSKKQDLTNDNLNRIATQIYNQNQMLRPIFERLIKILDKNEK